MLNRLFVFATLLTTGLIALAIGAGILIDPRQFHATLGIVVAEQTALTNEMRAAGGAIFALGLFSLYSVWVKRLALTALSVAVLIMGSYAVARFYSFTLDGIPNSRFLWVASLELVIAAQCVAALAIGRRIDSAHIHQAKCAES